MADKSVREQVRNEFQHAQRMEMAYRVMQRFDDNAPFPSGETQKLKDWMSAQTRRVFSMADQPVMVQELAPDPSRNYTVFQHYAPVKNGQQIKSEERSCQSNESATEWEAKEQQPGVEERGN